MHHAPSGPAPDGLGGAPRPRRPRRAIRIGAGLALIAGFGGAVYMASVPLGRVGQDAAVAGPRFYPIGSAVGGIDIGQRAPDFIGPESHAGLLVDLDGEPLRLSDFAGKPLWIVFWATWCIPCQQEAIDIRAAFHAHREGDLNVLAIDTREPAASVRSYVVANHLDYAIGLDPTAEVMDLYQTRGLPAHFFVDADGLVRARYFGQLTRELMEHYVAVITRD